MVLIMRFTLVPIMMYILYSMYKTCFTLLAIGVSTRPPNRWPSRRAFINESRANFLPEHLQGSQCPRSHIDTGYVIVGILDSLCGRTGLRD